MYTSIDIPLNQTAAEEDIRTVCAELLAPATGRRLTVHQLRQKVYWAGQQLRVALASIDNERRLAA